MRREDDVLRFPRLAGGACDEDHSALDGLLLCCDRTVIVPGGASSFLTWGPVMAAPNFYSQAPRFFTSPSLDPLALTRLAQRCLHANSSAITFAKYVMRVTAARSWLCNDQSRRASKEMAMKKNLILAAAILLATLWFALDAGVEALTLLS